MTGVLDLARRRRRPKPIRSCCRRSASTEPDALRGALQRMMTADCGVVRDADGLQLAAETLGDLARLADDLPAREHRELRGDQPVARLARDRRVGDASATESRGAHTRRDFPEPSDALLGRFVVRGGARARASSRCPASVAARPAMSRRFDPPASVVARGSSRTRWPRTSACSATSRRSRASTRTQHGRRPCSSPATTACSPAPRSRPRPTASSTRRRGRLDAARRRPIDAGARARRGRRAAARRSSPASGPRSTSCATARASPR